MKGFYQNFINNSLTDEEQIKPLYKGKWDKDTKNSLTSNGWLAIMDKIGPKIGFELLNY